MNELDWAERFNRDVDGLLRGAGPTDSELLPTEYHQTLDIARALTTTDFSAESREREALRRRLLNRFGAQGGWQSREGCVLRDFFRRRRPVVALGAVVLIAFLVVELAWPGTLAAAAQGVLNVIQRITLGSHTEAEQIEYQARIEPPPPFPSDGWIVKTDIGGFGGNVLPGEEPTVRSVTDFEKAQKLTAFHLRAPGYLPEGYSLREIKLSPGPSFLFYRGPGHDITLIQSPVGPQPSDDPQVHVVKKNKVVTNGTLEEVEFDGRSAVWMNGHSLIWEADGVSYTVGGLDLSLDEAIRIAGSLK